MKCFNCGAELIWQNDYSFEEYGIIEADGVVTTLECPECGTWWEGYNEIKEDEDE